MDLNTSYCFIYYRCPLCSLFFLIGYAIFCINWTFVVVLFLFPLLASLFYLSLVNLRFILYAVSKFIFKLLCSTSPITWDHYSSIVSFPSYHPSWYSCHTFIFYILLNIKMCYFCLKIISYRNYKWENKIVYIYIFMILTLFTL